MIVVRINLNALADKHLEVTQTLLSLIAPVGGLITVAALLPEKWDKRLVDANVERLKGKDILWADLVFIGGMTVQRTSARQIIDRCKALNVTVVVGMLQAIPGTRLFDRLEQESQVAESFAGDNVDGTTNIIPRMGMDNLFNGYQSIMRQIYQPKNYYRRFRTLFRELKVPEIIAPLDFQRFLSFFRAALRLGVFGKERFQYWYLILWTLIRKPKLVSTAVTLSIYGYHYRKICERYIY